MKKKVLILGANGMLGRDVYYFFKKKNNFKTFGSIRKKNKNYIKFDIKVDSLNKLKNFDFIINCTGIIKPRIKKNYLEAILINTFFPLKLSDYCKKNKIKLIHITTDCVFSGHKGNYDERSDHDALDEYGKTKSLGEPDNCMVIRTSIIGEEKKNKYSLIEWLKKNKNGNVNGFSDHIWNGFTTKYLALIIYQIILKNLFVEKKVHLYAKNKITKYNLLKLINDKLNLNISIKKIKSKNKIDRSLNSIHKNYLNKYKNISYKKMINNHLI